MGNLQFIPPLQGTDQQWACWHTCEITGLQPWHNVYGLHYVNGDYYMVAPVGIKEPKPKKRKTLFQRLFQ